MNSDKIASKGTGKSEMGRAVFCPVCLYSAPVKFRHMDGFDVYRCGRCQLLWVPNVDEEKLRQFYGAEYFRSSDKNFGYHNYIEDEKILRLNARHILAKFPKFNSAHPKILDIGCAHGFLLDEARKLGWDTDGVELSKEASSYAIEHLCLKVSCSSVFQANFPDDRFDYITIVGAIEHLSDPVRVIREAQRILKPSGYLAITTLNIRGLVKLFKLKPPEHLYYFSSQNISMLLRSCGYDVLKIAPYWCQYHLSEAFCRAFRLVFKSAGRIEKYIELLSFLKINMRVPTNEMFILSRKK